MAVWASSGLKSLGSPNMTCDEAPCTGGSLTGSRARQLPNMRLAQCERAFGCFQTSFKQGLLIIKLRSPQLDYLVKPSTMPVPKIAIHTKNNSDVKAWRMTAERSPSRLQWHSFLSARISSIMKFPALLFGSSHFLKPRTAGWTFTALQFHSPCASETLMSADAVCRHQEHARERGTGCVTSTAEEVSKSRFALCQRRLLYHEVYGERWDWILQPPPDRVARVHGTFLTIPPTALAQRPQFRISANRRHVSQIGCLREVQEAAISELDTGS